jgi:hypothetical protein
MVLVAGCLLVAAGCGGTPGGGAASDDSTADTTRGTGRLLVTLDGERHQLALTTCNVDEDRLTFHGADGDGGTAVGVLATEGSRGSLTVSDGEGAWVAGESVAHAFDRLEVEGTTASGAGTFAGQEYGDAADGARPVEGTGDTVDGTFEVTCAG